MSLFSYSGADDFAGHEVCCVRLGERRIDTVVNSSSLGWILVSRDRVPLPVLIGSGEPFDQV
jgi:hypothetical protein